MRKRVSEKSVDSKDESIKKEALNDSLDINAIAHASKKTKSESIVKKKRVSKKITKNASLKDSSNIPSIDTLATKTLADKLTISDSDSNISGDSAAVCNSSNNSISNPTIIDSKYSKMAEVINMQKLQKLCTIVPVERCFILCDGRRINTCKELADMLQLISEDIFAYHVTETKNDFSNWINDVFEDHELAKLLKDTKNRYDMRLQLYKYMLELVLE